ncbi:NTP transferase domain-containing protein [Candidatus Woesearchaeota archaeon]|jgi:UDP-N-acetylglucosamine diphosphorylase / glucose-1-phosphate thymidylyltransferase / UDP-N-acetylgalactosamine diphosphorylase / glucosamine-1-phosphate N-acetyltransferase / galactosamine-1-phosphate N-acetyltransferase|nr:NTP transferase domain-containing protein [Candidatus Woesearchaeota archaeon]MBT7929348.1 NTP transferase domain-containing protein [Candidatus Peregrinibacteria bacterium]MBT3537187.1 NTP transferase domain-containing protein [Candidatus Woesearchaeota archaeon]MBT4696667.1 NTP transferase domain-containing protein [Candidatus Woesearchaeota archaeon]MBT4716479.1 NTP transferase domain-containing protein [Candidatus Woesearchaeota archaeon]
MKAVILAAGKSTRTYPLTLTRPKSLIEFGGKNVLERIMDSIIGLVDEIVLVVEYKKEMIEEYFGDSYRDVPLKYVDQGEAKGTGHALLQARSHLDDRFLVLYGDDILSRTDIEKALQHDYCMLVKEVEHPERFGIVEVDGKKVIGLEEKPSVPKTNLANVGSFVFDASIFEHELKETERGEYEVTDYVKHLISSGKMECEIIQDYWITVGYPWDILKANVFFLNRFTESKIEGEIEEGVVIKGNVCVGKGTVIKSGTYIEGPAYIGENCTIGPKAYIRPNTSIASGCFMGNNVELFDAVILENTKCKHTAYIAHSVLGANINVGAFLVTADYRHDAGVHKTVLNGKKVDTGTKKLGAFIGDDVKTGINTMMYPGRKLWPGTTTLPGETVKEDKLK